MQIKYVSNQVLHSGSLNITRRISSYCPPPPVLTRDEVLVIHEWGCKYERCRKSWTIFFQIIQLIEVPATIQFAYRCSTSWKTWNFSYSVKCREKKLVIEGTTMSNDNGAQGFDGKKERRGGKNNTRNKCGKSRINGQTSPKFISNSLS